MSIETTCPDCGRQLSVPQETIGNDARCPLCDFVFRVEPPAAEFASTGAEPKEAELQEIACWYLKTPEGQTYGPVTKSEMDNWVRQGRVSADCQIRQADEPQWCQADHFYAAVREPLFPEQPEQPPHEETPIAAHRGVVILLLGLMGWVLFCPLVGLVAWVLGASDLREMRDGRMDKEGIRLTQAGHVLGMINTIVWFAAAIISFAVLLLSVT